MTEFPSGTVSFLFTDIEGSTALWECDREAMQAAVQRHLELLDTAIQAQGGVLFKTVGDAVQAAFPTASDAVDAALDAQRAIQGEDWGRIGLLRVRMALHTGTADPIAGDYLAPALNRLSRTLASGHGGQILATEAARALLAADLPPDVTLRSLGRHALRDLHEAEEIFQVVAPGLPDRFPELRSLPHHPTNLATLPTPLIGRDNELATVARMVRDEGSRLVTVTGPGGSGKTRLALGIAAELLNAFPDGVFFIDLASVRDAALVLPTVASVLNFREQPPETLREALAAFLTPKRMLLVLDNCEQVIDVAPDIAALLAACPRLAILATSREPLHIRFEQEYPLSPLALPMNGEAALADLTQVPAVALFVARARASDPQFALTAENADAVAEICRRLDGLPLAIELAAARIRLLPPSALLSRLDRRLPLLTGGPRDLPDRQQTMRNTVAWSYDLLDESEQSLFQLLSVFPSDFTLEAAEWVSGEVGGVEEASGREDTSRLPGSRTVSPQNIVPLSPPSTTRQMILPTLDLLTSLVAQSLVLAEGDQGASPRYRMLETIREFGQERLAACGQEAAPRQRHAAWALELAERAGPKVTGPDAAIWLEMLERDHPNLRAALSWFVEREDGARLARLCGALWPFWQEHAHYAEGRRWLEMALALSGEVPAKDRLRLLSGAGTLAWYQADATQFRQMNEQALALSQEIGDRAAEAFALGGLGVHASELGDYEQANARFEASLALAREVGDPDPVVLALHNLAHQAWERGQVTLALSRLEEALAVAREHRMGWILPSILVGLGTINTDLGEPARAIAFFRESIALAQVRGNLGDAIDGIGGLARLIAATGQPVEAVWLFGAADAIREGLAMPVAPSELQGIESIMNGLRADLGPDGFAAAWADGRSRSPREVIAKALALDIETAAGATPTSGSLTSMRGPA